MHWSTACDCPFPHGTGTYAQRGTDSKPVSVTRVGDLTPAGHQADGEAVDPSGCAALRGSAPPCWRHDSSAPRQATCRSLVGFGPSQYAPSRDIPPGGWDRCRTTDNSIRWLSLMSRQRWSFRRGRRQVGARLVPLVRLLMATTLMSEKELML